MINTRNRKTRLHYYILFFVIIAFLVWSGLFVYKTSSIGIDGERYFSLFDDAMISMRYAWNFSHGSGLVWNKGEYIQGYTNLLMVMLMSAVTLFLNKKLAVLSIQLLGIIFMLSIAYLSMKLSEEVFHSTPIDEKSDSQANKIQKIIVFISVLSYYPLVYWSLMGMETGLLTLLLTFGLLQALRFRRSLASHYIVTSALSFGLAYLTRPDSSVFIFIIWAYIFLGLLKDDKNRKLVFRGNFFFATTLLSFVVALGLSFQFFYYGHIFPNTYTLKLSQMPLTERISNGFGFLGPFLIFSFPILLSATALLIMRFSKQKIYILLSLVTSMICYQVYIGGDPWRYWRIISPVMPLALILAIGFVNILVSQNRLILFKHVLVSALVFLMLAFVNYPFSRQITFIQPAFTVVNNHSNINTAIAINEVTYDTASVGVFWAGTIPYYCDRKAIDFLGKSDLYVASLPPDLTGVVSWNGMNSVPGHNKYDLNYSIKTLQPTYVQKLKWGGQDLSALDGTMYAREKYRGINLLLLRDSRDVMWEKIRH